MCFIVSHSPWGGHGHYGKKIVSSFSSAYPSMYATCVRPCAFNKRFATFSLLVLQRILFDFIDNDLLHFALPAHHECKVPYHLHTNSFIARA